MLPKWQVFYTLSQKEHSAVAFRRVGTDNPRGTIYCAPKSVLHLREIGCKSFRELLRELVKSPLIAETLLLVLGQQDYHLMVLG